MILADKIIALRKREGWSQEELAEQLGVTRQSVSKWEGAQSVPDIDRILMMARLFGVSTDYLLKDELETAESLGDTVEPSLPPVRRVSMEEASRYLDIRRADAPKIALATFLCIISPVCLLMLSVMSETPRYGISEGAAVGIGVSALLIMVAAAVAVFIKCASRVKELEFLESESFETEYGVSGMVRERRESFRARHTQLTVTGTLLCIVGVIPLLIAAAMNMPDIICVGAVCLLLVIVGMGVIAFVYGGIYSEAMDQLLEEGDYTRREKSKKSVNGAISVIYWLVTTAVFLFYTFGPNGNGQAKSSWIIWAVAGVLYAAVMTVVRLVQDASGRK